MFDILIKNGQVVDGSGGMKDLTGQRFGRLVALYPTETRK